MNIDKSLLRENQTQHELIDFGEGRKLESFAGYVVDRPSPAARGSRRQQKEAWRHVDACYDEKQRKWRFDRPCPSDLLIDCGTFNMPVRPTPYGHLGLFPEQASNWRWLNSRAKQCCRGHLSAEGDTLVSQPIHPPGFESCREGQSRDSKPTDGTTASAEAVFAEPRNAEPRNREGKTSEGGSRQESFRQESLSPDSLSPDSLNPDSLNRDSLNSGQIVHDSADQGAPFQNRPWGLNLFGYTGASTLAMVSGGMAVSHVDAAKPNVQACRVAASANGWQASPVRYLVDDALKFARREVRRKRKYEMIVLDPPAYGHSPAGKAWRLERDLWPLLDSCVDLLSDSFSLLITGHSPEVGPDEVIDYLSGKQGLTKIDPGLDIKIESARSGLKTRSGRWLDAGFSVRVWTA